MTVRTTLIDRIAARAAQDLASQRRTCDGCAHLQTRPRPQCKGEGSPHYRRPRDTHQERCETFTVRVTA